MKKLFTFISVVTLFILSITLGKKAAAFVGKYKKKHMAKVA